MAPISISIVSACKSSVTATDGAQPVPPISAVICPEYAPAPVSALIISLLTVQEGSDQVLHAPPQRDVSNSPSSKSSIRSVVGASVAVCVGVIDGVSVCVCVKVFVEEGTKTVSVAVNVPVGVAVFVRVAVSV